MESSETSENQETTETAASSPAVLDEGKLFQYREKLRLEQNLVMGLLGGLTAALVGAVLWAMVTVSTGYQIGYMAVGVGFIVGYAVRYMGKGMDQIFGFTGAVLALIGCLMGNFLSLIGFAAQTEGVGYFEILGAIDYSLVPSIMAETFSPIDVLFYGLAIYEGYKFSFRVITEEEIMSNAAK
jgi:hypothetical protein